MKMFKGITMILAGACLLWQAVPAAELQALTLAQAREMALATHPKITVAELRVLVAKEEVTANRSGYLPNIMGNAMAAGAGETNTRLGSGSFTSSQVYDHVGLGVNVSQLITDFGRTANLIDAAKLRAKSADADLLATRAQMILEVDAAYYSALQGKALRGVAARTLDARQTLLKQVQALANNRLRSGLDVRFAKVGVDEARLLVDQAEQSWQSALATLASLIGRPIGENAVLEENTAVIVDLPREVDPLIDEAVRLRPELTHTRLERDASKALARAAGEARLPTIAAVGTAGVVPIRDEHFSHNYAAAALTLNVPLFTGGLYRARQHEAEFQARAAEANLQEEERVVIRDVRLAWLEAVHAHEQIELIKSLRDNASETLTLARERFQQGLSSTVELNQAELSEASAEIAQANADYAYRLRRDALDYQVGVLR